jgi:hypothetical protein
MVLCIQLRALALSGRAVATNGNDGGDGGSTNDNGASKLPSRATVEITEHNVPGNAAKHLKFRKGSSCAV